MSEFILMIGDLISSFLLCPWVILIVFLCFSLFVLFMILQFIGFIDWLESKLKSGDDHEL